MVKETVQQQILKKVDILAIKLYGENGFAGDIPEIKEALKEACQLSISNSVSISKIKGYLIGAGVLGVGGTGLGVWQLLS